VLERLLPAAVAVVETRGDADAPLFPEEEKTVARAVEKRRREFVTGRSCARAALAELGIEPQAIPSGARGEPVWPDGIVGSITHCDGFRACGVAPRAKLASIGIDAEADAPLPEGLLSDVALAEERHSLARLQAVRPGINWDRLLFCIKESVYKAWFPLTQSWLGFEDAVVAIEPHGGTFAASLLVPGPTLGETHLDGFQGRWLVSEGLLLSAIAVPAPQSRVSRF
jgi:4'-phosphopantetheinyl transferase EntD